MFNQTLPKPLEALALRSVPQFSPERFAAWLSETKTTHREAAKRFGVTTTTIYNWKTGGTTPQGDDLRAVEAALGGREYVPPDDPLGPGEPRKDKIYLSPDMGYEVKYYPDGGRDLLIYHSRRSPEEPEDPSTEPPAEEA